MRRAVGFAVGAKPVSAQGLFIGGSFFGQRNTERLRSGLGDESSTP